MAKTHDTARRPTFAAAVLDQMPIAVTVISADGTLLYYNDRATQILNRKPEFIGMNIRAFHKPESNAKLERVLEEFRSGRREDFYWEVQRGEVRLAINVAPLVEDGAFTGCIHCVRVLVAPPGA